MRDFSKVDSIINQWVDQNELTLSDSYGDIPLRSVHVIDAQKIKWLIWVEPENNQWCIHWWNYIDKKRSVESSTDNLMQNLQTVYASLNTMSL